MTGEPAVSAEPAMSAETGTAVPAARHAGNLPAELTSFVGRRREVAEVRRLLADARVATLTGVGGIGKTRLALRVAEESRRAFADGVWFVDLAVLDDPESLPRTVAMSLGMPDRSPLRTAAALAGYLAGRQALLLLDNCEHLADASAALVARLLRDCPGLRVLATSRRSLGVAGERTFTVRPLPLPDPGCAPSRPEALLEYESVALFAERARAAAEGFEITAGNRAAVAELCRRLEGMPLALELAATRVRVLSPAQILARLGDRYGLLTARRRTADPRQRSLRALIDGSHALCSEPERALWSRLSVFRGGCDVDAVERVCSGEGVPYEDVVDLLAGLADKSVLVVEEHGDRARYRMLEIIRAYGEERLAASGDLPALRRRHRDYYRRLAGQALDAWFGPRQRELMDTLRVEHANLRTALEPPLAEPGGEGACLVLATAAAAYSILGGSFGEGQHWLSRALAAGSARDGHRAKALWVDAWLALNRGDLPSAESRLAECHRLARGLADARHIAHAERGMGVAAMLRGDPRAAAGLFERALERHRALGDRYGVALTATRLGSVLARLADVERAAALLAEAVAACEASEESWCRAEALWELGVLAWQGGDAARGAELVRRSLRLRRPFGNRLGIAQCLEALAWMAGTARRHGRAARLLGAAGSIWRSIEASLFGYLADHRTRCEERARAALGDGPFAAAVAEGGRLTVDQGIGYALDEPPEAGGADGPPPPLTRRENEVAGLVAQGLSNKQIAAKLVISRRTAEGHVEHIFAKLGFSSRAQVAAWAAGRRDGPAG